MTKRATAEEFEAWKAECIANPSKLDGLPKSIAAYYRKDFGIDTPSERATSAISENLLQGLKMKLILHEDATFEEIAVFAYQITSLIAVIPTDEFQQLLKTAGDALTTLGFTWNDVATYLKAGAA